MIPDPRALTTDERSYQQPSLQRRHGCNPRHGAATPVMAVFGLDPRINPAIPMRIVADWHCIFHKVEVGRVETGGAMWWLARPETP